MSRFKIGGIMQNTRLTRIGVMSVPDRPGVAGAVLGALGQAEINVQFVVQCIDLHQHTHIICCIAPEDADRASAILGRVRGEIGAQEITMTPEVAIVSIFGPDFREIPGIAGTMCAALAEAGINIQAISTSISSCCCLIQADEIEDAMRVLHETFEAPHQVTKFAP